MILGTGMPRVGVQQRLSCGQGNQGDKSLPRGVGADSSAISNLEGNASASGPIPVNNGLPLSKTCSPGHHHFLPHHNNGYISPQYGWYVNITPPTPEMYFSRTPTQGGNADDKPSPFMLPQSYQHYQQFQYQQQYHPSPIPEGRTPLASPDGTPASPSLDGSKDGPQEHPLANVTQGRDQNSSTAMRKSLKPTFTKNRKGMGMVLAGNPHHVWPTVPFG